MSRAALVAASPPSPPREAIEARELAIPATDGYPLAATHVRGGDGASARSLVVVAGAIGVPRGFYAPFARALAARGHDVLTFDYRGIGGSRAGSLRAFPATLRHWGERDLEGVLVHARSAHARTTVDLVGHSVGGQLAALAPGLAGVRRLVGVASQLADLRRWPMPDRLRVEALMRVVLPALVHSLGYLPRWLGFGEDLPGGVALEWKRWCTTPGYYEPYLRADELDRIVRFAGPLLAVGIDRDPFAPAATVDAWRSMFASAAVTRVQLPARTGHFGFFRPASAARWRDVADFLAA